VNNFNFTQSIIWGLNYKHNREAKQHHHYTVSKLYKILARYTENQPKLNFKNDIVGLAATLDQLQQWVVMKVEDFEQHLNYF
jgi:hypothetical protein